MVFEKFKKKYNSFSIFLEYFPLKEVATFILTNISFFTCFVPFWFNLAQWFWSRIRKWKKVTDKQPARQGYGRWTKSDQSELLAEVGFKVQNKAL